MGARRCIAAALALAALASAGCSAVIGGRPDPGELLPCWVDDGIDPCPAGTRCVAGREGEPGRCAPMCVVGANEVCNGYDDDCDALIDEPDSPTLCPTGSICLEHVCQPPCELDGDGDGYTTCGGGPVRDCDDTRADIHPDAVEICDGIENDCDTATTDLEGCTAPALCARARGETTPRCLVPDCTNVVMCDAGETCDPSTGNCVPLVSDCRMGGAAACAGGERCDPGSGVCVTLRDLGQPCTSDVQCTSERCVPYGTLMLPPDGSGAPGMCATACCDDTSCPSGHRCWAPGNGVRACVPEAMRPVAASVRPCSAGAACDAAEVCDGRSVGRTGGGGDVSMYVCTAYAGGSRDTTAACEVHTDCASGFCFQPRVDPLGIGIYVPLGIGWCARPCGTSDDCNYPIDPLVAAAAGVRACGYQGLTTGERLQMCRDVGSRGSGANAANCGSDGDCRDGYCRGSRCSGVCCADDDCTATEVCAPVNRGGWEMRCIARFPTSPG